MEDKADGACDTYGGEYKCLAVFGREPWTLGRHRRKWDDDTRTDLVEMHKHCVNWI